MANKEPDNIAALRKAGFTGTFPTYSDMQEFLTASEKTPTVSALLKSIGADQSLSVQTREDMVTALGLKWKSDREVFNKLETDIKKDPELMLRIKVTVHGDPKAMASAINQYNGDDLAAILPVKGSYPASEKKYGSQKLSPLDVAAEMTAPPPLSEEDQAVAALRKNIGEVADKAVEKYGVSRATADGFVRKIQRDDNLARGIVANMKRNPEFVADLQRMMDDKAPKPKNAIIAMIAGQAAKTEINRIMANPHNLANDAYVKRLHGQIEEAENSTPSKMLAQTMGPLKNGVTQAGYYARAVTDKDDGPAAISVSRSGNSMLPDLMVDLDTIGRKAEMYKAQSYYSPLDMTALGRPGPDGKYFHDVPRKDDNGKPIMKRDGTPAMESVPNDQITVKMASGKEVKVIPSVGVLMAKQEKGFLDVNGTFVPGNIRVPVITAVDDLGNAKTLKTITMTPTAFAEYKKQCDELGRAKGGSIKELAFQDYTAKDLAEAQQKMDPIKLAQVNAQSGEVFHVTLQPNLLRNLPEPGQQQVARPNAPAPGNERDFKLQG